MFACSGFCVLLMRSIWVDCCLWGMFGCWWRLCFASGCAFVGGFGLFVCWFLVVDLLLFGCSVSGCDCGIGWFSVC